MATFTPPDRGKKLPPIAADTPTWQQKPAVWTAQSALIPRRVNVYKLTDGTYTETQPLSNAPFTAGWELVDVFYQGGASYEVDAAETAALTAAGYGEFIT